MAYKINYDSNVYKDLKHLPREIAKIALDKIEAGLKINPFIGFKLKHKDGYFYKYRIRDYRIIYTIDNVQKEVIIYRIQHRKDVYRGL